MTKSQKKALRKSKRLQQKKMKTFSNFKESVSDCSTVRVTEIPTQVNPEIVKATLALVNEEIQEEEKTNRFLVADELELFDSEGRNIQRWKGLVNKNNTEQIFNIVGRNYKIAQHDEVINAIEESISELELTHEETVIPMNDGARVHAIMTFPKIEQSLTNGEKLTMSVTFDNSYDSTTGLRMIVKAKTAKGHCLITTDSHGKYYHKHTPGMDLKDLKKKLEKGIDAFNNNIMEQFEKMLSNKLDIAKVINFLDKCIKEKVIAEKYLESIKSKLSTVKAGDVDNQFTLYNIIAEVLSAQVESIDAQKRHMETMYNKVKNL